MLAPAANAPCRDAAKAWRTEFKIPRATRLVSMGGLTGGPPPTSGTHPPVKKPYMRGGGEGGVLSR